MPHTPPEREAAPIIKVKTITIEEAEAAETQPITCSHFSSSSPIDHFIDRVCNTEALSPSPTLKPLITHLISAIIDEAVQHAADFIMREWFPELLAEEDEQDALLWEQERKKRMRQRIKLIKGGSK